MTLRCPGRLGSYEPVACESIEGYAKSRELAATGKRTRANRKPWIFSSDRWVQLCRTLHQRRRHRRQLCLQGTSCQSPVSSEVISSPSVGSVDPARIFAEVLAEEPVPEVASVASPAEGEVFPVKPLLKVSVPGEAGQEGPFLGPPWTNARLSSWRVFKSASRWRSKSPPPSRRRKPKLSPRLRLQARKLRPSRLRSRLFQKKCPSRSSRPLSLPAVPAAAEQEAQSQPQAKASKDGPGFR